MTGKQTALKALENLPEDASVEDAIERLCFVAKVEKGLGELDAGDSVSHEDVKRRLQSG